MLLVVSYTTVPPLPVPAEKPAIGGPFLWHYPSARADWTLSSILPCGARTFLSRQQGRQRLSVKLSVASLSIQGISQKLNPEVNANLSIQPFIYFYTKVKGSVFSDEGIASVSDLLLASCLFSQSATCCFITFSMLWPGSIMVMPAASASWAVW